MDKKWRRAAAETVSNRVPQDRCYRGTNVFWDKLATWANNGSCVEDIWNKFKDIIFEGVERFVPHKILK